MIEDVVTGRVIGTEVRPVRSGDLRELGRGWRFDWRVAVENMEVFKLVDPTIPQVILGLLGLTRCPNYVELPLVESHASHVGPSKRLRGIPGSLFAFAAQLSFELGGEGFLALDAKSELIEHFQRTYGFQRVGHSRSMVLATGAAARLIDLYGRSSTDE
jgi:hypothetical protein